MNQWIGRAKVQQQLCTEEGLRACFEQVRREHSHPEVRVRLAEGAVPELPCIERVVEETDGSLLLILHDDVTAEQALAELVAAGAPVQSFEPVLASMERIFIDVVRDAGAEEAA